MQITKVINDVTNNFNARIDSLEGAYRKMVEENIKLKIETLAAQNSVENVVRTLTQKLENWMTSMDEKIEHLNKKY